MTLSELRTSILSIPSDDELAAYALEQNPDEATKLNIQQQRQGKLKTGADIVPKYRPLTYFIKNQEGKENRWVTLFDTGSFQSKMYLVIKGATFTMNSDDFKTSKLIAKYTADIFGLTDENKATFMRLYGRRSIVRLISSITKIGTV